MTAASFSFTRLNFHPRRAPRRQTETPPLQKRRPEPKEYRSSYVMENKRQAHFRGGGVWVYRQTWKRQATRPESSTTRTSSS